MHICLSNDFIKNNLVGTVPSCIQIQFKIYKLVYHKVGFLVIHVRDLRMNHIASFHQKLSCEHTGMLGQVGQKCENRIYSCCFSSVKALLTQDTPAKKVWAYLLV